MCETEPPGVVIMLKSLDTSLNAEICDHSLFTLQLAILKN